jgi:hypothetical protein
MTITQPTDWWHPQVIGASRSSHQFLSPESSFAPSTKSTQVREHLYERARGLTCGGQAATNRLTWQEQEKETDNDEVLKLLTLRSRYPNQQNRFGLDERDCDSLLIGSGWTLSM